MTGPKTWFFDRAFLQQAPLRTLFQMH